MLVFPLNGQVQVGLSVNTREAWVFNVPVDVQQFYVPISEDVVHLEDIDEFEELLMIHELHDYFNKKSQYLYEDLVNMFNARLIVCALSNYKRC